MADPLSVGVHEAITLMEGAQLSEGDQGTRSAPPHHLYTLPGENLTTSESGDAAHWCRVYAKLCAFAENLLRRPEPRSATSMPGPVRTIETSPSSNANGDD